jgi:DNA-binding PadR family transcriptional regulator
MASRGAHYGPHPIGPWAPFAGPPFGPPWGRGWRAPKARRGDVRAAILSVLSDASLNGYQIIQQIADRSGGSWKPSPGSIYPTLQQLEDEGLVRADSADGKRTYTLTDEGRSYVAEHADEVAAPWQTMSDSESADDGLKPLIGQIAAAIWQIASVGTPEQQAKGKEALVELRRRLHAILAEADETEESRR